MCSLHVEVGYLKHQKEEDLWGEDVLTNKISAWMSRSNSSEKNDELRRAIHEIGIRMKLIEPTKRVIIRDEYWCSGSEYDEFLEVTPEGTIKRAYEDPEVISDTSNLESF